MSTISVSTLTSKTKSFIFERNDYSSESTMEDSRSFLEYSTGILKGIDLDAAAADDPRLRYILDRYYKCEEY